MKTIHQFRVVRRPADVVSRYDAIVVDGSGMPHQPLTIFYHEIQPYMADGTARTYLSSLLLYFEYLTTDSWREHRADQWDSEPEAVRQCVRDYLVEQMHCKARPKDLYQLISLTAKSPSTVQVFLSALKQFYHVARRLKWYSYPHPLIDSVSHLLQEINAEEQRTAGVRPRMPQQSGVEEPRRHLSHNTITACMRFLCHGMVFTDASGKLVLLKAHLLRHVFASHLRHVEKVPLDIVARILHQKDVRVTAYYSAPQWQQVVATTDTLLDRFATHLGSIEDAFVRAPAELQRQLEEAKQKVGPLTRVPGGECTCYALCPLSFACTGCVYKVPDPSRREEIVEQRQWAFVRLEQVKKRSLGPEIVKMQALVKRCDTELEEMDLMEDYQRDEAYDPKLSIHHGAEQVETDPSLAPETLRGETPANATIGQSRRRSARQRATNGHD